MLLHIPLYPWQGAHFANGHLDIPQLKLKVLNWASIHVGSAKYIYRVAYTGNIGNYKNVTTGDGLVIFLLSKKDTSFPCLAVQGWEVQSK